MITLTQDSEFMTNLLPANPVPAGNRFVAIKDAHSDPAVLALSQDNHLNLIIKQDGVPILVNYGQRCGLKSNVVAFDVFQDTDLTLCLAIATDAGNGYSHLTIVANLPASQILSPPQQSIFNTEATYSTIHGIYMSNFVRPVGSFKLPMIFLAFQPPDRITTEDQLGFLNITADLQDRLSFSLDRTWKLATNPLKIIDVAFGTAAVGQGAFVLYQSNNGLHLQFRVFQGHDFSVEVSVPPGASCLTSYVDPTSQNSVLLVGGDHITSFTWKQYVVPKGSGTPIVTGDKSLGLKDLHLAKTEKNLTVWYTTTNDAVHYYSASLDDLNGGLLVQLLPDGASGQVSGLLSATSAHGNVLVHTLISVNRNGHLTMLQQATDSGMWESIPFYTPSSTNNMEIPSYTMRIRATADGSDPDENPQNCQLRLTSSAQVQVTANGASSTLTQDGIWVTTDSNGTLSLIVATSDLACVTIKIDRFKSQVGLVKIIPDTTVNPTQKTTKNLQPISSGQDLLRAKTQTGEPLIAAGTVDPEIADQAAEAISHLSSQQTKQLLTNADFKKQTRNVKFSDHVKGIAPVHLAGMLPEDPERRAKMLSLGEISSPWDFFNCLFEEARSIVNWSLQKIGDAFHFVIDWLGDTFRFVLDSIQAIGKAISWVFNKILVAVEKLIEFIGFLFEWQDILQTADSIITFIDVGLSYGTSQIGGLRKAVDGYIQTLRDTVTNGKLKPPNTVTASDEQDSKSTLEMKAAQNGVAYNFGSYHMQHSGVAIDSQLTPKVSSNLLTDSASDLKGIWDSISSEVGTVKDLVEGIAQDIKDLFTPRTTTDQIFDRLKDQLITAALDTVQNVADFLLQAISLIISEFQDLGNADIRVPIFGALWNVITEGRRFTLFNCLSLILAIPTTILYKLAANKAPPKLEGRLTEKTFGQYVTGDSSLDLALARDIMALGSATAVSASAIGFTVTLISFVTDSVTLDAPLKATAHGHAGDVETASKLGVGPTAGNFIDGGIMFLDSIGLILSWPLKHKHDQDLRWAVWGLDLSNAVFLAASRIVGYKFNVPRVETKRFVGIWEVVTSTPTYVLEIIIDVHELDLPSGDPEKDDDLTTRHIIEETASLIGAWAFGVAAVNDEVNEDATIVALAVMGLGLTIDFALQFCDFVIWYNAPPKAPTIALPPVDGRPSAVKEKA
jgi:hypothetical protein